MTEDNIQAEIFRWFHNNYCTALNEPSLIIHSTPNGGTRNKAEAMKFKATGVVSGIADLTIKLPNSIFIDVEVKTENGKQSKNQKNIEAKLKKINCNYIVVRSLEEFKEKVIPIVKKYL